MAGVLDQVSQAQGVANAGTGVSDVGAVLTALPRSCGRHRRQYDGGCHVAGHQSVRQVRRAALEGGYPCTLTSSV